MTELRLTRSDDDRRLYALDGVGSLRLSGWGSRGAVAEAGERSWQIAGRGVLRPVLEAHDSAGTTVGRFSGRTLAGGGTLLWEGRELALRPSSVFRQRYVLADGARDLAMIESSGWQAPGAHRGRRGREVEPGLLLFAAYVANQLAKNNSAAVNATTG